MSALAVHAEQTPLSRTRSPLRVLAPLVVFFLVLIAVLGVRTIVGQHQAAGGAAAQAAAAKTFPTNATIEEKWGIRFTAINVLADGGIVEVRYVVLDPAKAARIHSGNLKDLPYLRDENTGQEVHSSSLMFHLHANHTPDEVDGRNYSIIFGNSDGAARMGNTVSVILPDGLRLDRVPVT
jgi:hypothetical protein